MYYGRDSQSAPIYSSLHPPGSDETLHMRPIPRVSQSTLSLWHFRNVQARVLIND